MSKYRLKGLGGVVIAAFVLVNTHAPDIANAAQFKPVIRTPRIIVRPPKVTPPTRRLIKKNKPNEVTNPAATRGGSAPEAGNPVQNRTPPRLRNQTRVAIPIPRARPQNDTADIPLMASNNSQKEKAKAAQVEAAEQEISAKREAAGEALVVAMVSAAIKLAGNALSPFLGNLCDSDCFNEALKRRHKRLKAAEDDLDDAQERVGSATADADSAHKNLKLMQNQTIPEAQRKDEENLRAQMERERAQLEGSLATTSQPANSWRAVKLRATQYLTLPANHPKLKALAARTQTDLEAIDRTMAQIENLKSSKRPNKDVARDILGQLRQHQLQLQQTEKELVTIGKSQFKQDEQELLSKRWEAMESIADSEIDEAKNNYEEAKEQFKLAMRILTEHMERMTQVTQKITS